MALENGVLVHYPLDKAGAAADATFTLTHPQLLGLLGGQLDLTEKLGAGSISVAGDPAVLAKLTGLLDSNDPDFSIATP